MKTKNTRRKFLKFAGLSTVSFALSGCTGGLWKRGKQNRPNIVWLISEDNSVHYSNLYNAGGVNMPNVNQLAKQGVIFNHTFCNSPVCSAARTALITGCYGSRIGTHYHRKIKKVTLPGQLKMFPAYLRDAGYYTSYRNKTDFNCNGGGIWDSKKDWSGRNPGQPFFHQHQFAITHESRLQSAGETGTDNESVTLPPYFPNTEVFRKTINTYYDLHRQLDRQIGEVIDQLKKEGLLEDTFIFYFGDNGGVAPCSKGYLYETGLHVPLVLRIPENFKHLVDLKPNTRFDGFVNFIDFAPTILNLAGLDVPEEMDGHAFLGPKVSMSKVNKKDESFGMADRFDEKYDMVRSLRKGKFKYIRSYQPFNFDGLQNNYRYKMVAYTEWRNLYKAGKLNDIQSRFFEPRDPEALYDLEKDPYEVNNLAGDPVYAGTLKKMCQKLTGIVKSLPDLSFYPESLLVKEAFDAPDKFGRQHKKQIAQLVDTADLALIPFKKAHSRIAAALKSDNPWQRYWGMIVCSCFGRKASIFIDKAKAIAAADAEPLVRVRAAEFLALIEAQNPQPVILDVLATTEDYAEAAITLNTLVMLRDGKPGYKFVLTKDSVKAKGSYIDWRMNDYLLKK
jgi:arylsulfatase A-like enzyme